MCKGKTLEGQRSVKNLSFFASGAIHEKKCRKKFRDHIKHQSSPPETSTPSSLHASELMIALWPDKF